MCNADAPDHRRVAKDDWRAGEAVEESNSGAKKNRRDVDVDFVEEPSIQALLDGVGAVDANGLPGGGGIIKWEKGPAHFPVATETEVQISLSLYDVSTSELIWSVTGSQKGGGGIFANDPASTARKLFDQMLEKLPNFCRRGAPGP